MLLAGCGARAYQGRAGRVLVERSARKKPDWIVRLPPSDHLFYATGFATRAASLAEGKSAAAMSAVEEVVAYLGLQTSVRFREKRTTLVTDVLNLIDSSAAGRITSGRMAELYYEHYRDFGRNGAADLYDVYVLYRVPMEEIEAERAQIAEERSKAVRRAEEALEGSAIPALGEDLIGAVARLVGAHRHLAQIIPASELLGRIESRLTEIAARTSLRIEVLEAPGGGVSPGLKLRAEASLLTSSGPIPIRNVLLSFETQGGGQVEATAVTDDEGKAEAVVDLLSRPLERLEIRVRLHPSLFPRLPTPSEGEASRSALQAALEALQAVSARLSAPAWDGGVVPEPGSPAGQADRNALDLLDVPPLPAEQPPPRPAPPAPAPARPVVILGGRRAISLGSRNGSFPVLVRLTSPTAAGVRRPRLNIALVLDTSGSMKPPEKIGFLKKGAAAAIRYLGPEDSLCIVTYATEPSVLFHARSFPGRRTLLHLLGMIEAGGRTNLGAGVQEALREIRRYVRPDHVNRMILLTDGLANEGITDRRGLVRLARQVRTSGVSLSTIGLGRDSDAELLQEMAGEGGARYSYASSAERLPTILAREVEGLLAETMGEITVEMALWSGVKLQDTYGYPVSAKGGRIEIPAGSLTEGDTRTLLMDLEVACQEEGVRPVGTFQIRYRDRLRQGEPASVERHFTTECSANLPAPETDEDPLVGAWAGLMRALGRLELALNSGDRVLAAEVDSFRRRGGPSIRAQATALGDRELLDLLDLFEHGLEEVEAWGSGAHTHEADEERDPRRDAQYRLYMLRHHGAGHHLLHPDWEEAEDSSP